MQCCASFQWIKQQQYAQIWPGHSSTHNGPHEGDSMLRSLNKEEEIKQRCSWTNPLRCRAQIKTNVSSPCPLSPSLSLSLYLSAWPPWLLFSSVVAVGFCFHLHSASLSLSLSVLPISGRSAVWLPVVALSARWLRPANRMARDCLPMLSSYTTESQDSHSSRYPSFGCPIVTVAHHEFRAPQLTAAATGDNS